MYSFDHIGNETWKRERLFWCYNAKVALKDSDKQKWNIQINKCRYSTGCCIGQSGCAFKVRHNKHTHFICNNHDGCSDSSYGVMMTSLLIILMCIAIVIHIVDIELK